MKNKASLTLMEQLIMVLVFALAAAICLRAFVSADRISQETAARDKAVYLAQNGAETIKACGGDFAEAAEHLGGEETENGLTVRYNDGFSLEVQEIFTQIPGLGQAEVRVIWDNQALFSLTAAWQEVGG